MKSINMGSINILDITDKIIPFKVKMKENSRSSSALNLMNSYSNFNQDHAVFLNILANNILDLEYDEQFNKTRTDCPIIKNLSHNIFARSKIDFLPHLYNFARFLSGNSEPSLLSLANNLNISHMLNNSPFLNKFEAQKNNSDMDSSSKVVATNNPPNLSTIKMTVSVEKTSAKKKQESEEKCNVANGLTLNLELTSRKTKELQKRSKKRRRRQKKSNQLPDKNLENTESSSIKKTSHACNFKKSPEVEFVLSIKHKPPASQSIMSSFVISVGSVSDDDSDWDCNSETSIHTETEEFDFPGLLVTNLTSSCFYSALSPNCGSASSNQNNNKEVSEFEMILIQVNKDWNESHKKISSKPKSQSKISFAADDELVKVFPVDIYDRKGEWEIYATERLRFKRRIEELAKVISPCLAPEHRLKVYKQLSEAGL